MRAENVGKRCATRRDLLVGRGGRDQQPEPKSESATTRQVTTQWSPRRNSVAGRETPAVWGALPVTELPPECCCPTWSHPSVLGFEPVLS